MPVIRMTRPPGYKRASIFLDLHGQRTETVDETGVDALGLARDLHAHPPRRHFLEQNAQLQLGEARADAAVNAVAEGPIGRASCRERVCQYGEISVVAGSLKKKKKYT